MLNLQTLLYMYLRVVQSNATTNLLCLSEVLPDIPEEVSVLFSFADS